MTSPHAIVEPGREPKESVGRQIARGATWMVAMRLMIRSIGLVSTLVLARLLVPADFGLVAMAMLMVAFLAAVSELSFDIVLIQKHDATRAHYDTVWTMQILRGLAWAVVVVAIAQPGAKFFNEPRLAELLYWLAVGIFIGGLSNVGTVDFRKHMAFHKDFAFQVLVKLISFMATMVAAFVLRSYWALIIGMLANQIAGCFLSYLFSPYRPSLTLVHWRSIFGFSKWLLFNNILQYLRNRADSLIIGRLLGAATLGLYTVALEISSLAASELVAPIMRAVLPGFSKLAHDDEALRRAFLQGSAIIQTICLPIAAGIGLTAHLAIPLLLGPKWAAAVPLIQVLTAYNLFYVVGTNLSPILLAKGRPDLLGKLAIIANVVTLPAMAVGTIFWGAIGTAVGLSAATGVLVGINLFVVSSLINLRWKECFYTQWRSWASVAAMSIAVLSFAAFNPAPPSLLGKAGDLVVSIVVGASSLISIQLILWWACGRPMGAESYLLEIAKRTWARRSHGPIAREGGK